MSLNWNATKIKDVTRLHEKDGQWEITHGLIWATLAVGLGEITEANVDEWFLRLKALAVAGVEPIPQLERTWIERRVGLTTNVFPNRTRKQFQANLGRILVEHVERQTRRVAA